MQVGLTIVRNRIRCLVPKNNAVVIVIENDRHAASFQCGCVQERFTHAHHVKRDLYQNSSATVRRHVSIHHFPSIVSQFRVVRGHCFDVLYSPPKEIAVQTSVDKHARNIQNRSSTRVLVLAHRSRNRECGARPSSSLNIDVSGCLPRRRSTIPHQRDHSHQSRSLKANSTDVKKFLVTTSLPLVYCHVH